MAYRLELVGVAGSPYLPDWSKLSASAIFTDVGTVSFDYALAGLNAGVLADQVEVRVMDGVGEVPDTRFIIEGTNGNRRSADSPTTRSFSGRTLWKVFGESLVYTANYPTDVGDGSRSFSGVTAGAILSPLFAKAQALGELTGITWDFNSTVDSNGKAWSMTLGSYSVDMGVNLLQVIQNLVDQGLVECRMDGRVFRAFNPGTLGSDLTTGANPIILWAAQNAIEVPEQTASKDLRTGYLIKGDNNVFTEVVDATAQAKYGRRMGYLSQGGIADTGTLKVLAQATVDRTKEIRSERTYKYQQVPSGFQAFRAFGNGDWLYVEMGKGLERLRVRQISVEADSSDDDGQVTLTLNDLFLEREVALTRKVNGITGGATAGGGSNALPVTSTDAVDRLAPGAVTGIGASSAAYVDHGITYAQITASWVQVTQNTDGSVCDDLDHYEIQWKYNSEARYDRRLTTQGTTVSWSPINTATIIQFMVRAVDRNNNAGAWSAAQQLTTASDAIAPPVPAAPVLTPWLGSVRISWNGKGSAGESMPPDFAYVEVHVSSTSNFTPSAATLYDRFQTAQVVTMTGASQTAPTYAKLIAYDTAGNASAASAQGSATGAYIGTDDFANDSIGYAKLTFKDAGNLIADGSMETANVRNSWPAQWTPINDAVGALHGSWYMRATMAGTGGQQLQTLVTEVLPYRPGDNFWMRCPSLMAATVPAGALTMGCRFYNSSKTFIAGSALEWAVTPRTGAWADFQQFLPGAAVPNSAAEYIQFYVYADTTKATTGTISIDALEVRKSVGTAIIEDAAITNAKIQNVAVNKLTAGSLLADMTVSSRIKTADTGARVELSATGLQAFNTAGTRTVLLSAADGTFSATGDIATGVAGINRVYMSGNARVPAGSSSALPGISLDVIDQPAGSVQASLLVYPRQAPNSFRSENSIQLISYRRSASPDSGATRFALSNSGFEIASMGTSTDDYGGRSFYIVGDRRNGAILDIMADSVLRLETDFWSIGHADGKSWSTGIWSYNDGSIHLTNIGYTTGAQMPNGDFFAYDISNRNGTATDNNRGGKFRGNQRMDGDGNKQGAGVLSSGTYGNDGIWFSYYSGQFRIWVNGVCVAYMVANGTAYGY